MKLLAIGDIHGRDNWKDKLFGSTYDYENWVTRDLLNGVTEEMADTWPFHKWDKIVFIGDYVDSFTVTNVMMLKNLEDIIRFKKAFPDKVVLILGNHDVQYIVKGQQCSGYRPEMQYDFESVFRANLDLFQMAYLADSTMPHPILFTHAGVSKSWEKELRNEFINAKSHKREMFAEIAESRIDELLNAAWSLNMSALYMVDSASGGFNRFAGPLWIRPHKLKGDPLPGYMQVVGHTPVKCVQEHFMGDPKDMLTVTLIDCLEHYDSGDYLELDF